MEEAFSKSALVNATQTVGTNLRLISNTPGLAHV